MQASERLRKAKRRRKGKALIRFRLCPCMNEVRLLDKQKQPLSSETEREDEV